MSGVLIWKKLYRKREADKQAGEVWLQACEWAAPVGLACQAQEDDDELRTGSRSHVLVRKAGQWERFGKSGRPSRAVLKTGEF
jgi:hypothetical protein